MKRAANTLFYSLLAASVAAHLVLLWLLPYSPLRPPPPVRRIFPVRLLERTIPAPVAPARARAPARKPSMAQTPAPEPALPVPPPQPAPAVQEPEPAPATLVEFPEAAVAAVELAAPAAAEGPAAAVSVSGSGDAAEAQAGAEIAAYQAMLSALRSRIERDIRYPGIARANGWQGTVLLVARMDGGGHLLGTLVRRSSGYETLDRAAASLLRKIMKGAPVPNPLRQPVSIEIPIVYELRN